MQSQNHLFKLLHRGYAGMINSRENASGKVVRPYEFHRRWIADSEAMRQHVESLTRGEVGVEDCPIKGIPARQAAE